jgi:glycerol-3-phosphate dehydrogenase
MAITLEDVLARRTRCLFLNSVETEKIAPKVAEIMRSFLEEDNNWLENQLLLFNKIIKNYQLC